MARSLVRLGGLAAIVGGLLWMIKGGAILLSGDQPRYVFEVAPLFFAGGLFGLHAGLAGRGGLPGRLGGYLAYVAMALSVVSVVSMIQNGDAPTSEAEFDAVVFANFLATLSSLVLLGIAVRRDALLPRPWNMLPLALGALTFPLIAIASAVEGLNERLLEVPVVIVGAAWVALGYQLWAVGQDQVASRQGTVRAP
jgi:hypothetical protein